MALIINLAGNKVPHSVDQGEPSDKFKCAIENVTKHAAGAAGKIEPTIYEIRKESNMVSISGEKAKSVGENHKLTSNRMEACGFHLRLTR
jgi:hypothetical protein